MRTLRRLMIVALAVVTPTLVVATEASAATPNFQMPFSCGTTMTAATFSGHHPANAVDFQKSGITGTPVLAAASGTVSVVANYGNTSYGRWVEVNHGGGWRTRYAHLSAQSVSVGQNVSLGTKLGAAGGTGGVTGPHLHFEEDLNGVSQRVVLNGVAVPYYAHTSFTSKNGCSGGSNPYTAAQACGSGYYEIDRHALGSAATVYLMWNTSTKKNCVATMKTSSVGTATAVSATLQVQGESATTASGNYKYYAGPVLKSANLKCVKWGGSAGSTSWTSDYSHCG